MGEAKQPLKRSYGMYRCVHSVERSSDGALYYALNSKTGQMVVLRTLTLRQHDRENVQDLLRAQLDELQRLRVPHIIPIEEYGIQGDELYFILPYHPKDTLAERFGHWQAQAKLPSVGEVALIVEHVAMALEGLHQADIVHGQLAPRVITFDRQGDLNVCEYGLIRLMKIVYALDESNSFSVTHYSAPELWDGARPTPASDQYALACIAYELLSGRPPYLAPNIAALMQAHHIQVAKPLQQLRPELPVSLDFVFWQALAKPAERRFEQINAFSQAFRQAAQEAPGEATGFYPLTSA